MTQQPPIAEGLQQVMGASATQTGLSQAEPEEVSALRASIPSANGPDLWRAILARMPKGSIVAGGAVRDFLLGYGPKDIDVFMGTSPIPTFEDDAPLDELVAYDPRHGLFRIDVEHERFEEYAAVSNILCVSSGTLLGHKVDAVELENFAGPEALVEEFDFGITRCWFDGEQIHDTPEAKHDRENHCITLLLNERVERSIARFERLRERWGGDWRLERAASAIEAGTAATVKQGAVHESAVAKPDAQPPSGPSHD